MYRAAKVVCALFPIPCFLFPVSASAATITWTGNAGTNNWHTAGNWDLNRVPTTGDDVVIPSGAGSVTFSTGTTSINSIQANQTLNLSGGTLNIQSTSSVGAFTLSGGGTLGGAGDVTITGAMTWSGNGGMSGTGRTIINNGVSVSINDGSAKQLHRTLDNHGAVTWTDGDINCSGGTLNNKSDGTWTTALVTLKGMNSGGSVHNEGVMTKTTSASWFVDLGTQFFNDGGTLNVQTGNLVLANGGTNAGTIDVAAAATLTFLNSYTYDPASSLTGEGRVTFSNGTHTFGAGILSTNRIIDIAGTVVFNGDYTFPGTVNLSGTLGGSGDVTITGAMTWSGNGGMSGTGRTIINNGVSVSINDGSAKQLHRTLDNHGAVTWTDGDINCSGGTLNNKSDGTWTTALVTLKGMNSGGSVHNEGVMTKTTSASWFVDLGTQFFNDGGTLNVQTGTLTLSNGGANSGTIDVAAGAALTFQDSTTHTGSLTGQGTLTFNGGTHNVTGTLETDRTINVGAGTVTFNASYTVTTLNINGGTLNLQAPSSVGAFALSGGTLGGTGDVTVTGSMSWTGGGMSGSGRTTIANGVNVTVNGGNKLLARALDNHGAVTWTDGDISLSGGTLNNKPDGTWTIALVTLKGMNSGGSVHNEGVMTKTTSASWFVDLGTQFFNDGGTLNVQTGTLTLSNGGANSGTIDVAAGAALTFQDSTVHTGSLTGQGTLSFNGGTHNVTGTLETDRTINVGAGTVTLNDDYTITALNLSGGTLDGDGNVTVTGTMSWTGGRMSGSGVTTIDNEGIATLSGPTKFLSRDLNNKGSVTWTAGDISLGGTTVLTNMPDGNWTTALPDLKGMNSGGEVHNEGVMTNTTSATWMVDLGTRFFNDGGTLNVQVGMIGLENLSNFSGTTLTGGTYIVSGTLRFNNANIVTNAATIVLDGASSQIVNQSNANALANFATNAAAGSLTLRNGRTLATLGAVSNAGAITLDAGTLDPNNLLTIQAGGTLRGNGSVLGSVTNAGICKAGLSPGSISIIGDYAQTAGGTFEAEIGGLSPGVGGFDQLDVSGTASLAGTLSVLLFGGFEPEVGDSFDIILAAARTDTFATTNLPLPFNQNCKGGPEYGADYVRINTYAQVIVSDQPDSQAICPGDPVTFAVSVDGTGPFIYQWRKDGENIEGATGDSYTDPDVQPADAGNYDVIVTNVCGFENSAAATLTVNVPPQVTQDPASQTHCQGESAGFSVTATGIPAPTYQWRKGGVNIPGATSPSLSINDVQPADAGSYDCVVTNLCDSEVSNPAVLTVDTPAQIADDPDPVVACSGSNVAFSVTASGTPAPTYQWRKGGINIPGATGPSLNLNNVQPADAAGYDCVATNVCGTETSATATLTVNVAPSISDDPDSQTVCPEDGASFCVTASGTPAPTYQWFKNGLAISGATQNCYSIPSVSATDAGSYDVDVSNACGEETSNPAVLTVNVPPSISDDPDSQAVCPGNPATFCVAASGTPAPTYQWFKDGSELPGATGNCYTIPSVAAGHAGSYDVDVTNDCGTETSSPAELTLNADPSISDQPDSQSVCSGGSATFSVTASGVPAVSYQWRKNGTPIGGATSPSLTIDPATPSNAGNYDCVITNSCGSITSDPASLTVGAPAATIVAAVTRKPDPGGPGGNCDLSLLPGIESEPRQGRVSQIRIAFNVAPGGPGPIPVSVEQATCAAPAFVPYSGLSVPSASVTGNELVVNFAPSLENARTYRITLNSSVTCTAGQHVYVRGLLGDVNSDGFVNSTDRSVVVGAWTGPGMTCATDVNSDGATNSTDRSIVVGAWTGTQNCAP